ncbi:hypothetical protein [Alteromonas ponticola]|uniref:Amino acid ABC transporter substrate-binding protein n=1 Tax=Alteromonas ponticola TaxID=2720613 RepID=A0ABX1QX82_9ALTE|nr:hypothetical protein [Alteromonas ponticola]NMH58860.1 amino acid ABC transporter substrate-binding protein [Alteromonas ponticola]
MNVFKYQVASLLALFIVSTHIVAEPERIYRVGVEDVPYYPLQDFRAPENKGVLASILRLFEEKQGISIEFIPLPIHRFSSWYDDGGIDFRIPDNPTWTDKLHPELKFSSPVLQLCNSTIVLAKNADKPPSEIKSIGTLFGFTPSNHWRSRIERGEMELITDSSTKVLTRMLLNEMVDGLDLDYSAIRHEVRELGHDVETVDVYRSVSQALVSYQMSTLHHEGILNQFNDFLQNHRDEIITIKKNFDVLSNSDCKYEL